MADDIQYRHIATDYHARDVDDFLDAILPACVSDKRAQMLRTAILDWAEGLAYEHGEERYECGKEAGEEIGREHGYQDAVDEINYEAKQADRIWDLRTMEAGLEARAIVLPNVNWLAVDPDDVTLTMPEHEAYRVLRVLRSVA